MKTILRDEMSVIALSVLLLSLLELIGKLPIL